MGGAVAVSLSVLVSSSFFAFLSCPESMYAYAKTR
jgi:hypothetical protein